MGFSRRIQNHPRLLAAGYKANLWVAMRMQFVIRILGAERLARWLYAPEEFAKRITAYQNGGGRELDARFNDVHNCESGLWTGRQVVTARE